jgi:hypothetical protein
MRLFASSFALLVALASVTSAVAGSAGRCGGAGGDHTKTLTCPSGQYVAGVSARGGLFVDEFSIACRKIPANGPAGDLGGFMSAGPGTGTDSESGSCSRKHAATTLTVLSGALIDNFFSAKCSTRNAEGGWNANFASDVTISIGGPGGRRCEVKCPRGEALYKVTVKYGGVVDSIRGECRK